MDHFPFILLRDDESLKIVNLKDYKIYDLIQEKKIKCYSYLQYFSIEYINEDNDMELVMLEWEE